MSVVTEKIIPVGDLNLRVNLCVISGTVIDTDQRSDSYMSGRGSGGVYNGNGAVKVDISTNVIVNRDIWLKDDNGNEHHIRVEHDFPVRSGQRLSFVEAHCDNGRVPVFIRNEVTGAECRLITPNNVYRKLAINKNFYSLSATAIIITTVLTLGTWGVGGLIAYFYFKQKAGNKVNGIVTTQLNQIAQSLLAPA